MKDHGDKPKDWTETLANALAKPTAGPSPIGNLFGSLAPPPAPPPSMNALARVISGMRNPPQPGMGNALRVPETSRLASLLAGLDPAVTKKRRVFIRFRGEDQSRVNGLRLLNANEKFDIEFYDESVRTPYNSTNATYIRRQIREKINRTSVTICMLSELTHTSQWVTWELEESIDKGNSIIAMSFKDGPSQLPFPEPIARLKLPVWRWDHNHLAELINAAP